MAMSVSCTKSAASAVSSASLRRKKGASSRSSNSSSVRYAEASPARLASIKAFRSDSGVRTLLKTPSAATAARLHRRDHAGQDILSQDGREKGYGFSLVSGQDILSQGYQATLNQLYDAAAGTRSRSI